MDTSSNPQDVEARASDTPPWKNPWIMGTIAGLFLITLGRPCTRYEPPPPEPVFKLSPDSVPADLFEALNGHVSIVLARSRPETSEQELRPVLERLHKGLKLWEQPVQLHGLGWGLDEVDSARGWSNWEWSEEQKKRFWALMDPHKEQLQTDSLSDGLWVISNRLELCGFMTPTEDGGIEAFHKAVRIHLEKTAGNY